MKAHLLRSTLLAALTVVPGVMSSAFAQDTVGPQPAAEEERDVVIITGSRIARQDYVANSPIVTVGQEDLAATGVTTLDTLLNEMPQFVPGVNMSSNNPSNGGQANVQLRGLGSNRTLVLMNGRRVVPSNPNGTVDVNVLPSQLVQSIEVITGGASATYGSDAIAGVVNFILRDDFEGFEVSATMGQTDRGDGNTESVSIATGGKFADGAGSAMLMVSYNRRDDIYNGDREFSSISGASGASPLGSTIFDGTNLPSAGAITAAVPGSTNSQTFGFNNDGSLFAYNGRNGFVSPGGIDYEGFGQPGATFNPDFAYNTGALNLLTLPQTRYNVFAHVDYAINDHAEVYTDFLFTQYESYQELAASPAAGPTGWRIPVSNPFITPELAGVLASRPDPLQTFRFDKRFNALGARRGAELYDVFQITTGIQGDLGIMDWTYDAYASLGRVDRTTTQTGNVSRSAVQRLLNATDGGASLCAGGFDWFGETTLSDSCKAFVGRSAKNLSINEQRNVEISMQGGAFALPAGEVRFAAGASYREDTFNLIPDGSLTGPITTQPCAANTAYPGTGANLPATACTGTATTLLTGNDIAGFNPAAPLTGAGDVTEVFGEVLIPVLKDLPFVQELNLTVAARSSDYSTVGRLSTYKVDGDWLVVDGVRFRGGYSQATRAPSISELFAAQTLGFPAIGAPQTAATATPPLAPQLSGDPCDTRSAYRSTAVTGGVGNQAAATNAQVEALCLAQGVNAAVIDSYTYTNGQVPGLSGGNPNLTEETAKTYSFGAVWQSQFEDPLLANLSASVDYYNIEVEDAVGTVSASDMIQLCFNSNGTSNPTYDPNNFYCSLFGRDSLSGNIINPISTNANLATLRISGIDFQVDWAYDIGPGTLDIGWVGSWLENSEYQNLPGGAFREQTGTIGNAVASTFPEWKWTADAYYRWGPARVGARWQHIDEMANFNNLTTGVPAMDYFDLIGSYELTDNISLRGTVNNVTDEQPPFYTPSVQANTDPSTYDVLGRRYTIGITMRY